MATDRNTELEQRFMAIYRVLCPTVNDDAPLTEVAKRLNLSIEETQSLALSLDEQGLIDTDRGMGTGITMIEGRDHT